MSDLESFAPQFGQVLVWLLLLSNARLQPKHTVSPKVRSASSANCLSSLLSARFCSNGISAIMCSTSSPASRIFLARSPCPALSASSHFSSVMVSTSVKSLTRVKVLLVTMSQQGIDIVMGGLKSGVTGPLMLIVSNRDLCFYCRDFPLQMRQVTLSWTPILRST